MGCSLEILHKLSLVVLGRVEKMVPCVHSVNLKFKFVFLSCRDNAGDETIIVTRDFILSFKSYFIQSDFSSTCDIGREVQLILWT